MNRVLLRFLWRRHRWATLLFGLVPILVGLIVGFVFPTYSKERKLLEVFKHTMKFFGQESLDMFSPEGSFSLAFQDPLVLIVYCVLPALAPLGLYAGDRGRGTLDLLLATPLDRAEVVRSLALFQAGQSLYFATLAYVGVFCAALMAGALSDLSMLSFLPLACVAFGVTICFGAIAAFISVLAPSRGRAQLQLGIVIFVTMALDVVARMWRQGSMLGWFTPLGYLRPSNLLTGEATTIMRVAYYAVPSVVAVFFWTLTTHFHRRRASA